jgi:membrane-bound lytic murein transglycosylase F
MVADGKIDYTVCDEHVAMVNQRYYPNIDISTPISFPQKLAWAVKKGSDSLLVEINTWLTTFKKTRKYKYLHRKYFENPKSVYMVQSEFYSAESGKISIFDDAIKKYSKEIDWDWRLLASLIYQESHFDPSAISWAGAKGLMQLMPATARKYGIDSLSSPEEHIYAGVKFIKWLNKQVPRDVKGKEERIKFILASYNAGIAHVLDARRLAKKYNRNPSIWDNNVDTFLLLKSNPKYFKDPVVKHGYCRGSEPYKFVTEIMQRYEHYKNIIPD